MSKSASPRIKSWHESKKLRKRAAFLLDNLDLIPTDVCFRITTADGMAEEFHGHKLVIKSIEEIPCVLNREFLSKFRMFTLTPQYVQQVDDKICHFIISCIPSRTGVAPLVQATCC